MADIAELGQHQRRALVLRQPRQAGEDGSQLLAYVELGGEPVDRLLGDLGGGSSRRARSTEMQWLRAITNSHGRTAAGAPERPRSL